MGKVCQSLLIHQVINYLSFGQGIFIAHGAGRKSQNPPLPPSMQICASGTLLRLHGLGHCLRRSHPEDATKTI